MIMFLREKLDLSRPSPKRRVASSNWERATFGSQSRRFLPCLSLLFLPILHHQFFLHLYRSNCPSIMSDDEVDHELLELLRQSLLGSTQKPDDITSDTKVLRHAEFIYDNSIDVNIDARSTRAAAQLIWSQMQQRNYSTETWSEHELHPKSKDEAALNFIFVMDLLNFSFWSEKSEDERFAVEYRGKKWTGYWSLVACLQRALDEGKF